MHPANPDVCLGPGRVWRRTFIEGLQMLVHAVNLERKTFMSHSSGIFTVPPNRPPVPQMIIFKCTLHQSS